MNTKTMKAADLFEIDKVQVFDRLTGEYICTMRLYDTSGDLRNIADYTPEIKSQEGEYKNPKQTELF